MVIGDLRMIATEGLTRKFGDQTAVENLTLTVKEGEIFGLLGPNGAGKTTTVRMLCCLISKTSGTATVAGHDIGAEPDQLKIRKLVGFVPDNVGLYEELSAYENLDIFGKLYECPDSIRRQNIERFLGMLGLWDKKDAAAGTFSKGMKQKLALARALVHDPQVLFMDEPTANLDPEAAKTVRDFIRGLKKEKRTIFLNTHNLDEAQRLCDRIGILNTTLRAIGTPEELERAVGGRKTVIRLEKPSDAILASLKGIVPDGIGVEGDRLTINVGDPEKENPAILDAIVRAGGRVKSVNVAGSTLEDAYLSLVRR